MKRLLSIGLAVLLVFTMIPLQSFASTNDSSKNVTLTTLERTDNYQKVEVKANTKSKSGNGTLEWVKNGDREYYVAKQNGKKTIIEQKDNKIYMNGEVVTEIEKVEPHNENSATISSSWEQLGTYRTSTDVDKAMVTEIAGLIASFLGSPITGAVTTLASSVFSMATPTIWQEKTQYWDTENYGDMKNVVRAYEHSNYTGYIGSATHEFRSMPPGY
ncbi:hypothetical protein [Lentibacillus cibarius]|uniref:Surface layer protein A domain-containing protein n=1 Tax=Lentibacillus cibarius TaxID=2583219 RepID=A0A5S3QFS2_9BACI|nr:hypothetical protein [Lentibacillus cibarius]RYG71261.1 hypothetical protein EU245_14690 [Lentibacillus lipolyticus]TMN18806.1 hypothetical protein FFL34_17800 [Lentibacillus cibarius]TMN18834.1 hypothetical protein FFL34_17965 [Lentibacillus cibarius]